MSKSNKQLEAESRVRIAKLHQEIKSTLAENPELAVLDELLSHEQDETGKYKVGLSQEQYDSLHSQISEGVVELGHELKRYVMRNHLEESNKRPLAVAQNEVIEVGQRLSALKSEESPNSKKIKKLEKEIFYKALELGSFPVETEFERSQAESNMKQDLRHAIQEKHGIRVNSTSFSMPSDAIIRAGRFPNSRRIIGECVAAEEIREDNLDSAIPLLQQRLESACEAELLIQSAVSSLVKENQLDITAQQYNEISSVFRKDMMKLDSKYIRENQGAITADISAALESGMSGKKIEGHDFSEASAGIAEKYNLAKEEGVLRDLKQFRGYFDGTLEKMKEKAERKGIDIDFTQYEELQEQWHELCDNAVARFDKTSGAKMTDKDISNIIMSMSHMSKGVNREFVDYFLKKPDYYLKQWQKLIPEKGKKLVDVSNTVAFSQDLALQRQSAEELGEKTRVARIRHVIDSMVDDYPELRQIESKLSKGHDSRKGTYDIGLTIDQYMELYESCQKIKAGNVDVAEEIAVMRKAVNKVLPLSRRIKSAFSRKSKAEYDPDSDIRPQNLSDADMETLAEVFDEVTALEKSTQQQLMSEVRRAGGVPSQAVEDSAVKREVAAIVADSPDLASNPIVLEVEERQRERETGVARVEEVEVIELASQESQLVVVLEEHLETVLEPVQILEPSRLAIDDMEEDRSHPAVKAQPKNQEQEARDSVIFGDEATEERQFEPSVTVTSNVVDPITQAIRDEVITRQQLYLQQEVAKVVGGAERMEILDQNLPEFRSFVESERGKEVLEEVAAKPQVQKQLHSMESAGYKAVHSQFNDRFRDVEWQAPSAGKVRSTNIKNSQGESVCALSETTFDTEPQNVVLSNGTARVIRSYRQIDFPKELETGKGPVHLSMAVKDENGKNIAEKDAVYFTAHYNESGKLEEVSTPVPVKFMGKGDDAIGYIERDGKVFTLPVTQGKYHEMMQEVAKNKGMNADLSQSVEMEKLASDIVVTNAKDVPSQLAKKAATIGKDVDTSKAGSVGHTATPAVQRKADSKSR